MSTKAQRAVFRHILQRTRTDAGLSQRDLARIVGVSPGAVSQWEMGQTAPKEEAVVTIERELKLDPGTLAGMLGYVTASPSTERTIASVGEAVEADDRLGPRERKLLMALYKELVRTRDVDAGP